jgi:hypothetical protein
MRHTPLNIGFLCATLATLLISKELRERLPAVTPSAEALAITLMGPMTSGVLSAGDGLQILYSVIERVSVDVVYDHVSRKHQSVRLLVDETM